MLCTGLHGKGKSSNDLCFGTPGMTQDEYATQFHRGVCGRRPWHYPLIHVPTPLQKIRLFAQNQ